MSNVKEALRQRVNREEEQAAHWDDGPGREEQIAAVAEQLCKAIASAVAQGVVYEQYAYNGLFSVTHCRQRYAVATLYFRWEQVAHQKVKCHYQQGDGYTCSGYRIEYAAEEDFAEIIARINRFLESSEICVARERNNHLKYVTFNRKPGTADNSWRLRAQRSARLDSFQPTHFVCIF